MQDILKGITINGKHSNLLFDAIIAKRVEDFPEIFSIVETSPYSQVEYNFSSVTGMSTYSRRDVTFCFKFVSEDAELKRDTFANFLFSLGADDHEIYDDYMQEDYHWVGRLQSIKRIDTVGEEVGARMLEVTFRCEPYRIPNGKKAYEVDESLFPDLNGDGEADATDAAMISEAVAKIGSGQPSGLTPEQEIRADADRDGEISSTDAALVLVFSACVGAGMYENNPTGWTEFLNIKQGRQENKI